MESIYEQWITDECYLMDSEKLASWLIGVNFISKRQVELVPNMSLALMNALQHENDFVTIHPRYKKLKCGIGVGLYKGHIFLQFMNILERPA